MNQIPQDPAPRRLQPHQLLFISPPKGRHDLHLLAVLAVLAVLVAKISSFHGKFSCNLCLTVNVGTSWHLMSVVDEPFGYWPSIKLRSHPKKQKSSKIKDISTNVGKTTKDIDLWQLWAMAMAIVLPMSLPGLEARNLQLRQGPRLCAIEVVHNVLTCFKKNHGIMGYHMISYDIMMISRNILGCHGV